MQHANIFGMVENFTSLPLSVFSAFLVLNTLKKMCILAFVSSTNTVVIPL